MPSAMTLWRLLVWCRVVSSGRTVDEEPCLPGSLFANGNNFHVLITRGDTRRCTKKRSAARSGGPAIRAVESLFWREERGLCVSESARASEACVCVRARQQRYQRWYNSLNTQWQSRAVLRHYISHCSHFFRSLASTCVNSRKPRAPHHRPTPAGTDNRTDTHR